MDSTNITPPTEQPRKNLVVGAVLVALGLILLAAQWFSLGGLALPVLAVFFLAVGIGTRQAGWMIPGGILGGIALGAGLIEKQLVSAQAEGGIFLLCFALGWVTIYLLSKLFTPDPQRWALIPGGIMALIGGAILLGEAGERFLGLAFSIATVIWPLILVAIGISIILRARRNAA